MPVGDFVLTYELDKTKGKPLYEQLYNCIREDIISGKEKGGTKLPSKRKLAEHLDISKVTVENAYSLLLSEGYIYSKEKSGYYIEDDINVPLSDYTVAESIDENNSYKIDLLSNSVPAEQFPFNTWSKLMRNICLDYTDELLRTIPFRGVYQLRKSISRYLYEERGVTVSPDDIIIGAGSELLYRYIIKLLPENSIIGCEDPTYPKIIKTYQQDNVIVNTISLDDNGIDVSKLRNSSCNVAHISPSHNFPTGIVTSAKRRQELLTWLNEEKNRYIIEDDFDSELSFSGKPIPTLYSTDNSGRVIYMNTFSKTIAPSVRIGYAILPHSLIKNAKQLFSNNSCTVSSFEQYTLSEFIDDGYFERHINRTRRYYKNLKKELIACYNNSEIRNKSTFIESIAGLHFMLKLNTEISDNELKSMLKSKEIKASFYSDYAKNNPSEHLLLINYSGISTEDFKEVLNSLQEII